MSHLSRLTAGTTFDQGFLACRFLARSAKGVARGCSAKLDLASGAVFDLEKRRLSVAEATLQVPSIMREFRLVSPGAALENGITVPPMLRAEYVLVDLAGLRAALGAFHEYLCDFGLNPRLTESGMVVFSDELMPCDAGAGLSDGLAPVPSALPPVRAVARKGPAEILYHRTTSDRLASILAHGLRINSALNMTIGGVWSFPIYGCVPVFLSQSRRTRYAAHADVLLAVDAAGLDLVADLPGLGDAGADYDLDWGAVWWSRGKPRAFRGMEEGVEEVGFAELIAPGSWASEAARRTTRTAACLESIAPDRIRVLKRP